MAVLIGLGLCLLVAITIGQLARHLPSAGGLYTYNARGLGTGFGFMVGWAFLLAEVVVAPGGLLILGIVASTVRHAHLGWPAWTWAPFAAGAGALVWFLVWRGIKLSTAASVSPGAPPVRHALGRHPRADVRERRAEFNVLLHGLIPLAAFVLFIPVLLAAFGADFAGLGITPLAFPANDVLPVGADVGVVVLHDMHRRLFRGCAATIDPGVPRDEIRLLVRVGALVLGYQPARPCVRAVIEQQPVDVLISGILIPGDVPDRLIVHLAGHVRLFLGEQLIE
jgi:hypothetical protein